MCWNIVIADNHHTIRVGTKLLINSVIARHHEASTGEEVLEILDNYPVDLVIVAVKMPGKDGIETTSIVRRKYPQVRIIIHSEFRHDLLVLNLLEKGVRGFVSKSDHKLVTAVCMVMNGRTYLSPDIDHLIHWQRNGFIKRPIHFTRMETKILALCAIGFTSDEIANSLELTAGTVENYRKRMIKKFRVRNMTELVDYAHRIGKL